jgi:hypothetical protein
MSPLLVQLLRRGALLTMLLALVLLVAPRLLTNVGVIGPTAEELTASAAASLQAARTYGATDDLPSFVAAKKALEEAQAELRSGRLREARRSARRAAEKAVVAQREGLVHRDQSQRRAEAIVKEVDRRLNDLENLYGRAAKKAGKPRVAELLSLMKEARQAGSGLVLAFEQDDLGRVIAGERTVFATLDRVRDELRDAVGS